VRRLALLAALALAASVSLAQAEPVQKGSLRVSFSGKISPKALPRSGSAPIEVELAGQISTVDGSLPPQLQKIAIALNRQGHLDPVGLPVCRLEQIQPSTTAHALEECGAAKVGEGSFSASVAVPGAAPFPADGKLIAFNGVQNGKPVLLAHIYGTDPVPTSYTLTFRIARTAGTFGTTLTTSLPQVTSDVGFVTGLDLTLGRKFSYQGRPRSYLSAACPAPKGFPGAVFSLARASFGFAGGRSLGLTLTRSCRVRG
jgi:hypothetical protein